MILTFLLFTLVQAQLPTPPPPQPLVPIEHNALMQLYDDLGVKKRKKNKSNKVEKQTLQLFSHAVPVPQQNATSHYVLDLTQLNRVQN